MRDRIGPTTTNIQWASVVVDLPFLANSNTYSDVSSISIKSFDVSEIGMFLPGPVLLSLRGT